MPITGQAPEPGQPGGFILTKESLRGQSLIRVLSGVSNIAGITLAASAVDAADTGYINNRLSVTTDGKLIDFVDVFPATWTNAFVNDPTASDFTLEVLRGSAFSDEEDRIIVGQYNPFTPDTGYSAINVPNFHNFDTAASYTIWTQSVWKVFIIGDPQ